MSEIQSSFLYQQQFSIQSLSIETSFNYSSFALAHARCRKMNYVLVLSLVCCILKFCQCFPYDSPINSKYARVAVWGKNQTNLTSAARSINNGNIWNHRLVHYFSQLRQLLTKNLLFLGLIQVVPQTAKSLLQFINTQCTKDLSLNQIRKSNMFPALGR